MANPQFIITDEGLKAAHLAYATGIKISITSFKVGASFGFTPAVGDTDIHGALLYGPASPFAWNITSDGYLDVILKMDLSVGPFDFGNIGIYLEDGTLFALAAWDEAQHKRATIGTIIGNNRIIHAVLKLANAPIIINVITGSGGGMIMEIPSWAALGPTTSYSENNCAIIHESNGCGEHVFVIRKVDPFWTPIGYDPYLTDTITAATTTTFTAANVTTRFWDLDTPNRYIARFSNGLIRAVGNVVGTTVYLTAALPSVPSGSVTILESECARSFDCTPVVGIGDYNALVNSFNPVWDSPNGFTTSSLASGWNETALPVMVSSKPTNSDWTNLINAAYAGATLTASSMGVDFPPNDENFRVCPGDVSGVSMLTRMNRFTALQATIAEIVANRFRFTNLAAFETTAPVSGLKTRTSTPWANTTHIVLVDFASAAAMQGFFNSGGRVIFTSSVTGGGLNPKETAWQTMFSTQSTLSHTYSDTIRAGSGGTTHVIGMYDLTGSNQTLFSNSSVVSSSTLSYQLQGRRTSTTQLEFTITYGDSNPSAYYGSATLGVVMSSQISLRRASSTVLTSPVVSYPTLTQSGTL